MQLWHFWRIQFCFKRIFLFWGFLMFPHELDSPETLQYMVIHSSPCLIWRHWWLVMLTWSPTQGIIVQFLPCTFTVFFPLKLIAVSTELLSDLAQSLRQNFSRLIFVIKTKTLLGYLKIITWGFKSKLATAYWNTFSSKVKQT